MKRERFIQLCYPWAKAAGEYFKLNPVVILAQAAIESGWGVSNLSTTYHNYFGITGYGVNNQWWDGEKVTLGVHSLPFRIYKSPQDSFMDYARLICSAYRSAAELSFHPEAYAKAIAYSPYISEVNGDNREGYRKMLVTIAKGLQGKLPEG